MLRGERRFGPLQWSIHCLVVPRRQGERDDGHEWSGERLAIRETVEGVIEAVDLSHA